MEVEHHEMLMYYSIIANLLKIIDEYERDISPDKRKLEQLPDNIYDWCVSFMEEANETTDEGFEMLLGYFEGSLTKQHEIYRKMN